MKYNIEIKSAIRSNLCRNVIVGYGWSYTKNSLLVDDDDYGYIDDLKAVAQCQGYSSEEIDGLL